MTPPVPKVSGPIHPRRRAAARSGPATLWRAPFAAAAAAVCLAAPRAEAFWVDGAGFYGLQGATETSPDFSHATGTYQAIQQTFLLNGEARFNDQSSMFLEFHLFPDPRAAYLGDTGQPSDCTDPQSGARLHGAACEGQHQNTGAPSYKPYTPTVTKAYVRYAFDYCIIEAGRRGRDWGLGMFLDSGSKPFDQSASLFDGVGCDVNVQKSQTLGFSVGYDKLAETGKPVDPRWRTNNNSQDARLFGSNDPNDDLDQFYFTIQYDDRKANAGSTFTKQVGVYFAQISGKPYASQVYADPKAPTHNLTKETGGDDTDLKFLDLYTGFYVGDLTLRNEVLFRMGKSRDPNWGDLGGQRTDAAGQPANNRLDSIALAGDFDWTIAHSGASIGPAEFNKGDATRHVLFFNYAYAPGDADGYINDQTTDPNGVVTPQLSRDTGRSGKVKAIAFNRNFKPALLLFNAHPAGDALIVDGAFNPGQMVNATLFATGYRYESMENGAFEVKLLTANMNTSVPGVVRDYYQTINGTAADDGTRPAGFYGRSYGYELDLSYMRKFGRDAEVGVQGAAALPGKAWQVSTSDRPANDFLIQTTAVFHF